MWTEEQLRLWGAELTLCPLGLQPLPPPPQQLPLPSPPRQQLLPPPLPPPQLPIAYVPPLQPPIPALEGMIQQCSEPYEKQLTESDVKTSQCRLALKNKYVREKLKPMLREDERMQSGVAVSVYDGEGEEYEMTFKEWGKMMVLGSRGWNKFLQRHDLRKDVDFVSVWMFRRIGDDRLCFALTCSRVHGVRRRTKRRKKGSKRQRLIEAL